MMLVDLDRGRIEGIALAKTLEELETGDQDSVGLLYNSEDDFN